MTKTFENFPDLTADLAFGLIDKLKDKDGLTTEFGMSNQSCSAYVNVTFWDSDGDYLDDIKVRFSDHDDRHGSDITIRIDHLVDAIYDDGEYVQTNIEEANYDEALNEALKAVHDRQD